MFKKLFPKKSNLSGDDQFKEGNEELRKLESDPKLIKAIFAGGCFWCMEGPLESVEGVVGVVLGVTDGRESALVFYDPNVTQFKSLVERYWKFIDPTDAGGQFVDRGSRYRIGVYYYSPEQQQIINQYIEEMKQSGKYQSPIVLEVLPATEFTLAEDSHQNYYKKQSKNYKEYYKGSGRQDYVELNK